MRIARFAPGARREAFETPSFDGWSPVRPLPRGIPANPRTRNRTMAGSPHHRVRHGDGRRGGGSEDPGVEGEIAGLLRAVGSGGVVGALEVRFPYAASPPIRQPDSPAAAAAAAAVAPAVVMTWRAGQVQGGAALGATAGSSRRVARMAAGEDAEELTIPIREPDRAAGQRDCSTAASSAQATRTERQLRHPAFTRTSEVVVRGAGARTRPEPRQPRSPSTRGR